MGVSLGRMLGKGVSGHPVLALLLAAILLGVSSWGLKDMGIQTDFRTFFSQRNPDLKSFIDFEERYGQENLLVFVLKRREGSVLEDEFLMHLYDLTDEAGELPQAGSVDSFITALSALPPSADRAAAQEKLASAPLVEGRFISKDRKATAIFVNMNLTGESPFEVKIITDAARELIARYQEELPIYDYAVTGNIPLNAAIIDTSTRDGMLLFPALAIIIFVFLRLFFGAWMPVIVTLVTVVASSIAALGLGGWAGLTINAASAVAPTIVLTLAIANCVHLLVGSARRDVAGATRQEATAGAVERNFRPIVMTSLTTAAGFLSLNFSDAPPIQSLGNITAMGVSISLVLGLLIVPSLPIVLKNWRLAGPGVDFEGWRRRRGGQLVKGLMWLAVPVLILAAGLTGLALYKASQMEINDSLVDYFDPSVQFRQDAEFAQENLIGLNVVDFSIPAGGTGGLYAPAYLERISAFDAWLETQPEVTSAVGISDVYRQIAMLLGRGEGLPADEEEARRLLALAGRPDGPNMSALINEAGNQSRVSASVQTVPTLQLLDLKVRAENWLKAEFPGAEEVRATGWSIMFAQLTVRNVKGMIAGTVLTLVVVSIILAFFFASLRMALLALLVNVVPLAVTYGIWGALGEQFSLAATTAAAVAVGILVDFSIHLLARFRFALREMNHSREEAAAYAFEQVGPPILVITLTLVAGFAVLVLSHFGFNRSLGAMTAIAISLAFLTNILVLPALLRVFSRA